MQKQSVCGELQQLRISAGMSQKALAELLGVNVASICLWESGRRIPKRDKLEKLATLFHCSISGVSAPATFSATLGNQLRGLRTKSGQTLDQVLAAELLHCAQKNISRWENNVVAPTLNYLEKMAALYICNINDLI